MGINSSKIYDELLNLRIDLDFNNVPTPSYIQEKIIQCNTYQRQVEKNFITVQQELSKKERLHRTEKLNLDVKKRQTLTNNESVRKKPTGKEREAAVDELLEDDYIKLCELENDVCRLKDLRDAIKAVQYNLRGTNSDIKLLIKVMEQQINRLNIGSQDDPEVKDLYDDFKDIEDMERDMEEEMTAEDVESSSDHVEEKTLDTDMRDIGDDTEDESAEETPIEDTSDVDSQDDIGDDTEDSTKDESAEETPIEDTSDADSHGDDEDDIISSFLMEDDSDHIDDESFDKQEEEVPEDEDTAGNTEPASEDKNNLTDGVGDKEDTSEGIDLDDMEIDFDDSSNDESDDISIDNDDQDIQEAPEKATDKSDEKENSDSESEKETDDVDDGIDIDDILSNFND